MSKAEFEKALNDWWLKQSVVNPPYKDVANWAREFTINEASKHHHKEVKELQAKLEVAIEALEFYGQWRHDDNDWGPVFEKRNDGTYKSSKRGRTAREALTKLKGEGEDD